MRIIPRRGGRGGHKLQTTYFQEAIEAGIHECDGVGVRVTPGTNHALPCRTGKEAAGQMATAAMMPPLPETMTSYFVS